MRCFVQKDHIVRPPPRKSIAVVGTDFSLHPLLNKFVPLVGVSSQFYIIFFKSYSVYLGQLSKLHVLPPFYVSSNAKSSFSLAMQTLLQEGFHI